MTTDQLEAVNSGKTKIVRRDPACEGGSIATCLDVVSWKNKHKQELPGKGVLSAATTSAVFEFLERMTAVPIAYRGRGDLPNEFKGFWTDMLPFEVIFRQSNEPNSSYGKRNPDAPLGRFPEPIVEFHLKTSGLIYEGIEVPDHDPFVGAVTEQGLYVFRADEPVTGSGTFIPAALLGLRFGHELPQLMELLRTQTLAVGNALVAGFARLGFTLGDFKVEYGYVEGGCVMLSDVLDNDSWRIQDPDGIERSKQTVRNADSVEGALFNYQMVANAAEALRSVK